MIDDLLVVGTGEGPATVVHGLDGATGESRWQTELERTIRFPAEETSGVLIVVIARDEDFGDY